PPCSPHRRASGTPSQPFRALCPTRLPKSARMAGERRRAASRTGSRNESADKLGDKREDYPGMTKWRRAFAAWSTQIHKCRTFSLDQLGLPCASTSVRGQPHVGYAQAVKRPDSQVVSADARAYVRHVPTARHCI